MVKRRDDHFLCENEGLTSKSQAESFQAPPIQYSHHRYHKVISHVRQVGSGHTCGMYVCVYV